MQYIDNVYLSRLLEKSGNFMWSWKWPPCNNGDSNNKYLTQTLKNWQVMNLKDKMLLQFAAECRIQKWMG